MKENDYGYFGKGTEGYIHYKMTMDRCYPHEAKYSSPAPQKKSVSQGDPSDNSTAAVLVGLAAIALFIILLGACGSIEYVFDLIAFAALGVLFVRWVFT